MALQQERSRATFPVEQMSHLIYGNPEYFEHFMAIQKMVDAQPGLQFDPNFNNKSRQEQLLDAADQFVRVTRVLALSDERNFIAGALCFQKLVFTSVHQGMVIPAFKVLASDKQIRHWLPKLVDFTAIGCYAQTELSHGSDVQSLQTTATYVPETNEFIISTPNVGATKYWPGELGLLSKFALLYCQLIVEGKSHGVHPLWVPIRDANHDPILGVEVGDIGPKMGYSTKDNGFLSFSNYRVSGDSLLQRFIKIKNGKVEERGNPKVGYASMMIMRKVICETYTRFAGMALTIAVRYSLVRKQFKDDKGEEIRVLDYQLQQEKLFPMIAEFYAVILGGLRVKALVEENFEKVVKHEDFSMMGLTHAILSGCKANYTQFVVHAAEWSRLSCGGHGFAHYSGLPAIYKENSPNVTLEGENTVMYLQLVRFMLKQLRNQLGGSKKPVSPYFDFVKVQPDPAVLKADITQLDQLYLLHQWNTNSLLQFAAQKLTAQHGNLSTKQIWNQKAGIALHKAAMTYIPLFNLRIFIEKIDYIEDISMREVLVQLARLYGVQMLLQNMHGLLLRNLITGEQISQLKAAKEQLLEQIRPNALALVECQGFTDNSLKTQIGCYDGEVYNRLYDYATNKNSVNAQDPLIQKAQENIKKMSQYSPKL